MKTLGIIFLIAITASALLGIYVSGIHRDATDWSRGYSDCMARVVKELAGSEGVYLGNITLAPNTSVSNCTFFVVDPNVYGIETDSNAVNCKILDCYFDSCGMRE